MTKNDFEESREPRFMASTAVGRTCPLAACAFMLACGAQADFPDRDSQPRNAQPDERFDTMLVDVELSDTARMIVNEYSPGRMAVSVQGDEDNDADLRVAMGAVTGDALDMYVTAMAVAGLEPSHISVLQEAQERAHLIADAPAGEPPPVEKPEAFEEDPLTEKHLETVDGLIAPCHPDFVDTERAKARWAHGRTGTYRTYYEWPVFHFDSAAMGRGPRTVRHTVEYWQEAYGDECSFTLCGYGVPASWDLVVPEVDLEDREWHQVYYRQNETEEFKAKVHSLYEGTNFDYCSYKVKP